MSNELPEAGVVYITLRTFLARIADEQQALPEAERLPVPTIEELSRAIGVSDQTLYNYINGTVKLANLQTCAAILDEMGRRGFAMELTDLLRYQRGKAAVPPDRE